LPAFAKPSCEGSSVGAARVVGEGDIANAVGVARAYGGEMLVEEMVVGDEITVAILGDVALPSIRIVPAGEWYDYNAKYLADDTQYLCPGLDEAGERAAAGLALAAFVAAGCSGWGRVDLMRERATGRLLLLEVNTAPGMTSHSLVPKAAAQVGIDYAELCWRVLEQTVGRRRSAASSRWARGRWPWRWSRCRWWRWSTAGSAPSAGRCARCGSQTGWSAWTPRACARWWRRT